jgi:hypothetical protein
MHLTASTSVLFGYSFFVALKVIVASAFFYLIKLFCSYTPGRQQSVIANITWKAKEYNSYIRLGKRRGAIANIHLGKRRDAIANIGLGELIVRWLVESAV